jgi:hypothetical protein
LLKKPRIARGYHPRSAAAEGIHNMVVFWDAAFARMTVERASQQPVKSINQLQKEHKHPGSAVSWIVTSNIYMEWTPEKHECSIPFHGEQMAFKLRSLQQAPTEIENEISSAGEMIVSERFFVIFYRQHLCKSTFSLKKRGAPHALSLARAIDHCDTARPASLAIGPIRDAIRRSTKLPLSQRD